MKLLKLIEDNGLLEKWNSGEYTMALQVNTGEACDAIVCPGPGLSNERIMFRFVDVDTDIPEDQINFIHMIPTSIWESMKNSNSLNEEKN